MNRKVSNKQSNNASQGHRNARTNQKLVEQK